MKINEEACDRFYKEVGIHLAREGFSVLEQRDGLLPLEWCGAPLCRITAGGGAQFRREDLEREGAADAFCRATDIAHTTAEYMATLALQNGVDVKTVSGMLGHYSAGFTLDTYAHVTTYAQREAANTMGNVLQGV